MFDRYRRTVDESTELDLIPVMNLFMVLIPFLLMGAAFVHVGVIPASLPAHTPNQSDVPVTPTTVTVNLSILVDRMELTVSSNSLSPDKLASLGGVWNHKQGEPDIAGVRNRLATLKGAYPKSDTMIVLPNEEVPYQQLVQILDGTREEPVPEGGDPEKAKVLFPVIVFSRLLTAEATP